MISTAHASLWRDERGLGMIEFAAIAPILALFLVGIADLGLGYAHRFALQQAVNRTIEMAQLGATDLTFDYLKVEAAAAAGVPLTNVDLEKWLQCNAGTKKSYLDGCASGDEVGRYVKLTVRSSFKPLFTSIAFPNKQADGTVLFSANTTLRIQ